MERVAFHIGQIFHHTFWLLLIETMPQELSKIAQSVHSKHKRKFDCFLNCKMQILLLIWPFKLVEGSQGVSLGPTIKVTTSKV